MNEADWNDTEKHYQKQGFDPLGDPLNVKLNDDDHSRILLRFLDKFTILYINYLINNSFLGLSFQSSITNDPSLFIYIKFINYGYLSIYFIYIINLALHSLVINNY